MGNKIIAVTSGSDLYGVATKHLVLNDGVDLAAQKKVYQEWHNSFVEADRKASKLISLSKYVPFSKWLVKNGLAHYTDIEVLYED